MTSAARSNSVVDEARLPSEMRSVGGTRECTRGCEGGQDRSISRRDAARVMQVTRTDARDDLYSGVYAHDAREADRTDDRGTRHGRDPARVRGAVQRARRATRNRELLVAAQHAEPVQP